MAWFARDIWEGIHDTEGRLEDTTAFLVNLAMLFCVSHVYCPMYASNLKKTFIDVMSGPLACLD
jgi:hypothetical protein